MPKGKRKAGDMARSWAKTAGGNVRVTFTITPDQEKALRSEAFKRAAETGAARPDAGAIVREILDEWLRKRGR